MNREMPVGVDDFKEAREQYYIVDKTAFIGELIDKHKKVTLFTRPRRFGKTLTMSMLDYFFSIDKKDISKTLFRGLAIDKSEKNYIENHQNQYPVIFITLKDFHNPTWESMYRSIRLLMQEVYAQYPYLRNSDALQPFEQAFIDRITYLTAEPEEYQMSLQRLSGFLYKYFGKQPIILIDEYDAPLQRAYMGRFYQEAALFWKGWFNAALKNNRYLHFAVLTGVLRIAKESIFSGLNNLDVYSVLDEQYSRVFGFTSHEVQRMVQDLQCEDTLREIKQWYDGYTFGQTEIYNPWSVIKYFATLCKPAAYWISTSDNGILQQLLHNVDTTQLKVLQDLLTGKHVTTSINDNIIYQNVTLDKSSLYTMLLTTGYLTVDTAIDKADERYALRIPNEEIRRVYRLEILNTLIHSWNKDAFDVMSDALVHGQAAVFERQLQQLLIHFVSAFDAANKESFYHGFMLGMTALFITKDYVIESNRESGYGRFDLAIFPMNPVHAGVIMEFKVAQSEAELKTKAQEALQQIETKAYITEFKKRQIANVWKYGIAFSGKHVKIVQSTQER